MNIKEKIPNLDFNMLILLFVIFDSYLFAVISQSESKTWLRFKEPIESIKVSPQGHYIAYRELGNSHLKILDVKTKNITTVSNSYGIGQSFFWSPYGFRLFFRETHLAQKKQLLKTKVWGYDCVSQEKILLTEHKNKTGFLTFNPIENKAYFINQNGINSIKLSYPGVELEKWKKASRYSHGRFVVGQKGVLWSSNNGLKIKQLKDDMSKVQSYSISADGRYIAWSTQKGNLFVAANGEEAFLLDKGKDPQWHTRKNILLYVGARILGSVASNYDIKSWVVDKKKKWHTNTPQLDEKSPAWYANSNEILYLKEKTTDIFLMSVKP